MVKIFQREHFKTMPWKNGGGLTNELYCLPNPQANSFFFRLSRAEVSSDGPFSIFPNIDRTLLLIEGSGFNLKSHERQVELNEKLDAFTFKGEEAFSCTLLAGPCVDFNVMTDRNYANSTISVIHLANNTGLNVSCDCDLKFVYDIANEKLYQFEKGDHCNLDMNHASSLIVIEVTLKK